jgi:hypothetical protein
MHGKLGMRNMDVDSDCWRTIMDLEETIFLENIYNCANMNKRKKNDCSVDMSNNFPIINL